MICILGNQLYFNHLRIANELTPESVASCGKVTAGINGAEEISYGRVLSPLVDS